MLATPLVSAKWSAMGGIEPDNQYEGDGLFNWADKPGAATKRIYFQVFTTDGGTNPNVGAEGTLETHNEAGTIQNTYALLGVWRDCNGDGYIGLAESALLEYPASLLSSTAICPAITGTPNGNAAYQQNGYPSNYNGWVTEFIHIGGNGSDPEDDINDGRVIRDNAAMVWGDFGLPDQSADAAGGTCALSPLPRGTVQSTGGALNYVDCLTGLLEQWNAVFAGRTVAGQPVPGLDPENSLGLQFADDDNATRGGHPLHQQTFGSEDSSHAAIRTTDCAAAIVRAGDVINATPIEQTLRDAGVLEEDAFLGGEDLHNTQVNTPTPSANTNPTTWTIPGQLNQTNEEFDDCDTSNDRGDDFYGIVEGDFEGSTQSNLGKRQAENNFGFNDVARGQAPNNALAAGNLGAQNPPGNSRLRTSPFLLTFTSSIWDANVNLVKAGVQLVRTDLQAGTVEPAQPWLETFYAYVGSNTTSKGFLTPGTNAVYGDAQCSTIGVGAPVENGWNCDPTQWYINSGTGQPMPEPTDTAANARVGQPYQLRDIDCADGQTNLGVPLGVPALGADPCNE